MASATATPSIVFQSESGSTPLQPLDPNTTSTSSSANSGSAKESRTKTSGNSASPKNESKTKHPAVADLAHINLPGEEAQTIAIFDTCDDVRRKIRDHLKLPGITQAGFSRELSELMPYDKVQPKHLSKFLSFKGPRAGGHSPAFYAAYVYFEKLRLHQGKKKSAKREKLEQAWAGQGGFPREGSHNMYLTCPAGESWRIDYLGQVQIQGEPRLGGPIYRKKSTK